MQAVGSMAAFAVSFNTLRRAFSRRDPFGTASAGACPHFFGGGRR
jgi:hypothetical protein